MRLDGISGYKHATPTTWKQNRITDTLVAKLYKAHNATPQHDIFKTPEQASQNPSNFGDKWKYLCSSITSSFSLEGYMHQLVDASPWSSLRQEICFTPIYRNHAFRNAPKQWQPTAPILPLLPQARWELQRRSFMMAPVFAANFGPHFGVQKVAYLLKMIPTRAQSPAAPISMTLVTIPWSCSILYWNFAQAVLSCKAGKQKFLFMCPTSMFHVANLTSAYGRNKQAWQISKVAE